MCVCLCVCLFFNFGTGCRLMEIMEKNYGNLLKFDTLVNWANTWRRFFYNLFHFFYSVEIIYLTYSKIKHLIIKIKCLYQLTTPLYLQLQLQLFFFTKNISTPSKDSVGENTGIKCSKVFSRLRCSWIWKHFHEMDDLRPILRFRWTQERNRLHLKGNTFHLFQLHSCTRVVMYLQREWEILTLVLFMFPWVGFEHWLISQY